MKRLVLATHNKDKVKEFHDLLAGLDIEVVSLDAFPAVGEIKEDGETLEENALIKAREVHRVTGLPSLADDTGLEVFYLNGAPGVFSSRYAGEHATYEDNVRKLLRDLGGVPPRRRRAQFRCVLAYVGADRSEHLVEGVCGGVMTESPRGTNGFGYDPVFLPEGHAGTFGELSAEEKNAISHRARAALRMREHLAVR